MLLYLAEYAIRFCKNFTIAEKSQTLIFILLFDHLVIKSGIHSKTHYPFPETAVEVVIHHKNLHEQKENQSKIVMLLSDNATIISPFFINQWYN